MTSPRRRRWNCLLCN